MIYNLEIRLVSSNAKFYLKDRANTLLSVVQSENNGQLVIASKIEMPNRLFLEVVPTDNSLSVELKSVSLGHIKFNNNLLDRIFIYRTSNGDDKSTIWTQPGTVEFEFFDHDPITYHLNIGTTI